MMRWGDRLREDAPPTWLYVFAGFMGGLIVGWMQHLYWVSLVTR